MRTTGSACVHPSTHGGKLRDAQLLLQLGPDLPDRLRDLDLRKRACRTTTQNKVGATRVTLCEEL